MDNSTDINARTCYIYDCRPCNKSYTDNYIYSGTDTYICSKTYRNSYRNYGNGNMDTQRDSCFYEYLMGQLQSVYIVKVLFFKFENGKVSKI